MDVTPKAEAKIKNKQVELHQGKMLLQSKGNRQQNEKATFGIGVNICKPYIQNTEEIHTIQY